MLNAETLKKLEQESLMRQVFDLRVFVVGGGFQYMKMFYDAGFKGAQGVHDADFVCFTGGEDVDPGFYGEEPLPETFFNTERDRYESGIFNDALDKKRPMVGICRGSQFLNVMNGGKLWQDVNNHAVSSGHSVLDMRDGSTRNNMTSTHHQMMRPADEAEIIAAASLSTQKRCEKHSLHRLEPEFDDIEVVWYGDSLSLAFQPHPEFRPGECRDFFLDLVDNYIMPAC